MVMNFSRLASRVLPLTQSTVIWGCWAVNWLALSWYCSVSDPAAAHASQVTVAGALLAPPPAPSWPAVVPWAQAPSSSPPVSPAPPPAAVTRPLRVAIRSSPACRTSSLVAPSEPGAPGEPGEPGEPGAPVSDPL